MILVGLTPKPLAPARLTDDIRSLFLHHRRRGGGGGQWLAQDEGGADMVPTYCHRTRIPNRESLTGDPPFER